VLPASARVADRHDGGVVSGLGTRRDSRVVRFRAVRPFAHVQSRRPEAASLAYATTRLAAGWLAAGRPRRRATGRRARALYFFFQTHAVCYTHALLALCRLLLCPLEAVPPPRGPELTMNSQSLSSTDPCLKEAWRRRQQHLECSRLRPSCGGESDGSRRATATATGRPNDCESCGPRPHGRTDTWRARNKLGRRQLTTSDYDEACALLGVRGPNTGERVGRRDGPLLKGLLLSLAKRCHSAAHHQFAAAVWTPPPVVCSSRASFGPAAGRPVMWCGGADTGAGRRTRCRAHQLACRRELTADSGGDAEGGRSVGRAAARALIREASATSAPQMPTAELVAVHSQLVGAGVVRTPGRWRRPLERAGEAGGPRRRQLAPRAGRRHQLLSPAGPNNQLPPLHVRAHRGPPCTNWPSVSNVAAPSQPPATSVIITTTVRRARSRVRRPPAASPPSPARSCPAPTPWARLAWPAANQLLLAPCRAKVSVRV
jgi:hypothetical protein